MSREDWHDYLASFHTERPGITEAILAKTSTRDSDDPYAWLAEALPGNGTVLDVACGSGPLVSHAGHRWVGLDRNGSELGLAARVAPGRVILADVDAAPLAGSSVSAVVCSMALMVFDDPRRALTEMAHALRPGGAFVALVPAFSPLTMRDRLRYARLLATLRLPRLPFPRYHVLTRPEALLAPAGLRLVSAERRRFAYPLTDADAGLAWLRSLYLPHLDVRRLRAARRLVQRWTGSDIGIPLRRIVATKTP